MLSNLVIGIGYKARQGKGTVAEGISDFCRRSGLLYKTFSISELIREHSVALGLLPDGKMREDFTPAEIKVLVDEGTRMREKDPAHWTSQIRRAIWDSDCAVACIDNVRFFTEIEVVRGMRPRRVGYLIEARRFDANGMRFVSPDRDPRAATEVGLDGYIGWDFIVKNTRDRDWVKDQATAIMTWICRKEGIS